MFDPEIRINDVGQRKAMRRMYEWWRWSCTSTEGVAQAMRPTCNTCTRCGNTDMRADRPHGMLHLVGVRSHMRFKNTGVVASACRSTKRAGLGIIACGRCSSILDSSQLHCHLVVGPLLRPSRCNMSFSFSSILRFRVQKRALPVLPLLENTVSAIQFEQKRNSALKFVLGRHWIHRATTPA